MSSGFLSRVDELRDFARSKRRIFESQSICVFSHSFLHHSEQVSLTRAEKENMEWIWSRVITGHYTAPLFAAIQAFSLCIVP